MDNHNPGLHFLVKKQLDRLSISEEHISAEKHAQWNEFLNCISKCLYDCEQERYLTERSMEISSQEMMALNNKLEVAQEIAHLGYWTYDKKVNKFSWSKEMFRLTGIDYENGAPTVDQFLDLVHPLERKEVRILTKRAFTEGKDNEIELRFKNANGKYYWYYIKIHPQINNTNSEQTQPIQILSGIMLDITRRKQDELRKNLLHKVTYILAENLSFTIAAPKLLEIICEQLELDVGELWMVDKNNNVLRNNFIWTRNNTKMKEFIEISKRLTFLPGESLPGRVWSENKISYIIDVVDDLNFPRAQAAKIDNLHGAFGLPITFGGEVLGVIDFLSKNIFMFDDDIINLLHDIDKQIGIFIEREQNQMRIAKLSRQAGMSEIATSVLHNIGNVLNSANTSISIILETIRRPYLKRIIFICNMIKEHLSLKDDYLTEDPKGKKIPDYLIALSKTLSDEADETFNEIKNIDLHLSHIKDIVMLQKEFSGISGVKENVLLAEVIDLSIQMSNVSTAILATAINIEKKYNYHKFIMVDRTKLLQIIINLFNNAKDSVISSQENFDKSIVISTAQTDENHIEIKVKDNGLGIPKEDLIMIFSLGFTTKANGHGFGLHSSAIAAKELGGNLSVKSDGEGKGATFILKLPIIKEIILNREQIDSMNT